MLDITIGGFTPPNSILAGATDTVPTSTAEAVAALGASPTSSTDGTITVTTSSVDNVLVLAIVSVFNPIIANISEDPNINAVWEEIGTATVGSVTYSFFVLQGAASTAYTIIVISGRQYTMPYANTTSGLGWRSMRLTEVYAPTGNTFYIEGVLHASQRGIFVVPKSEEEIRVTFYDTAHPAGMVIFGGVVERGGLKLVSKGRMVLTIEARDYMKWLDRRLVSGVYTDRIPGLMVASILRDFANVQEEDDGVRFYFAPRTADNEPQFDTEFGNILPKNYNLRALSETVQDIAENSDGVWWPDHTKGIHFVPSESLTNMPPGLPVVTVPVLGTDGVTSETPVGLYNLDDEINLSNFEMEANTSNLVNALVVNNFFFRSPQPTFIPPNDDDTGFSTDNVREFTGPEANGFITTLPYKPYSLTDDDFEVWFSEDRATYRRMDVQLDPNTRLSSTRIMPPVDTVYVGFGDGETGAYIRWSPVQRLSTSAAFRVKLRPFLAALFPELAHNIRSIIHFEEVTGGVHDGVYEQLVSFDDLEFSGENPVDAFNEYGSRLLRRRSWPVYTGKFTCLSSDSTGWRSRQRFYVTSEEFEIFDEQHHVRMGSPAHDITRPYYMTRPPIRAIVKTVTTEAINAQELKHTITWSSTESDF